MLEQFGSKETEENIPGLEVEVLAPTANMPLGGNNAACVIVFCTSISQSSSLNSMLDRLLRRTLQSNNQVGTPPTQLVGISTLGTERSEKFPYSMQNMMGGKLDSRRQIEEVLINTVRNRLTEPPLDYTLIKMKGDKFNGSGDGSLEIAPGDVLDEATSLEAAAQTVLQAVAYQPAARNATLSIAGSMSLSPADNKEEEYDSWQELFLPLDGPEVWRSNNLFTASNANDSKLQGLYDLLVEYLKEWGDLLASSGKGLTTPIRSSHGFLYETRTMVPPRTILKQDGVQLLFLPTATGKKYMSRDEEMERDKVRRGGASGGSSSTETATQPRKMAQEGGIDVVVEAVLKPQQSESYLRVRARRCNYADDAIIKELSETTIVKRLEDAMNVWMKEQQL